MLILFLLYTRQFICVIPFLLFSFHFPHSFHHFACQSPQGLALWHLIAFIIVIMQHMLHFVFPITKLPLSLSITVSLALLCILTSAPSFVSNLHFLPAFSLCASALCTLIIFFSASSQHFTRCLLFFSPQSLSCSSPCLLPSPFCLLPWSSFR